MDARTKPWPKLSPAPRGRRINSSGQLERINLNLTPWSRRIFPPGFGVGWTASHPYTGATLMELHDDPEVFG